MTYSLVNKKRIVENDLVRLEHLERLTDRLLEGGCLSDVPNALTRKMLCTRRAGEILKYARLAEQLEGRPFEEVVNACVARVLEAQKG